MPGRRLTSLALLAALASCGAEEKEPPPKKPAAAAPPTFAGVEEVRNTPDSDTNLLVSWRKATDDYTPDDELKYELLTWNRNPARAGAGATPTVTDVTGIVRDTACDPCTYRFGTGTLGNTVYWFSVVVTDRDSVHGPEAGGGAGGSGGAGGDADHTAGEDVVKPGSRKVAEPAFAAEGWASPAGGPAGTRISITGNRFLDEPVSEDALKIGGVAVPQESIESWNTQLITFAIPAGAATGTVEITTLFGTATSPAPLIVSP